MRQQVSQGAVRESRFVRQEETVRESVWKSVRESDRELGVRVCQGVCQGNESQ